VSVWRLVALLHGGLVELHLRLGLIEHALVVVDRVLGHDPVTEQLRVARKGDPRVHEVRLVLVQLRTGGRERCGILVDDDLIRSRIDLGAELRVVSAVTYRDTSVPPRK